MYSPKVSVIISVYNTEKYIAEAIQSVLNQSYTNIELIVVDDGSTDSSDAVIRSFTDSRIVYRPNDINRGIVYSFNKGLELATGEYIAFLGSDDVFSETKLEKQVQFLESNANYGFVGSDVIQIDSDGNKVQVTSFLSDSDLIRCTLLFKNCFCASSVLFRSPAILKHRFDPNFPVAEDYDMYLKIINDGWLCSNINEALTSYRVHGQNITLTKKKLVEEKDSYLLKTQLDTIGFNYTVEEFRLLFLLGKLDFKEYVDEYSSYRFEFINNTLSRLIIANSATNSLNTTYLINYLFKYWKGSFVTIDKYDKALYTAVKQRAFWQQLSQVEKIKFYIKCLINKTV